MPNDYEIERKFLVKDPSNIIKVWRNQREILQCYTTMTENECTRIRVSTVNDYLGNSHPYTCDFTYKRRISDITRVENEASITLINAIEDIVKSRQPIQTKTRYLMPYEPDNSLTWEVDVFKGDNEGLIIVEIEMPSEDYDLIIPDWVGKEVTHDMKYTNVQLSANPFKTWR